MANRDRNSVEFVFARFMIAVMMTVGSLSCTSSEPINPTSVSESTLVNEAGSEQTQLLQPDGQQGGTDQSASESISSSEAETSEDAKPTEPKWVSLFDGKSLEGWEITKFGGEGDVEVKDGRLVLGFGSDMTGVHTRQKIPSINYELRLEAMRVDGSDFFCGLTFPVKSDPCSLIIGGWGGGVCGLSSIDGLDASENETTTYRSFENGQWYRIRLRVTEKKIEAWIDKKQIVDQEITGRKLSIRAEVELSKPFGFATWQTTAALRNIRIRQLAASEMAAVAEKTTEAE